MHATCPNHLILLDSITLENGTNPASYPRVPGALSLATTHLYLVPRSKNAWSYNSTPQHAFISWCSVKNITGTTVPLPLPLPLPLPFAMKLRRVFPETLNLWSRRWIKGDRYYSTSGKVATQMLWTGINDAAERRSTGWETKLCGACSPPCVMFGYLAAGLAFTFPAARIWVRVCLCLVNHIKFTAERKPWRNYHVLSKICLKPDVTCIENKRKRHSVPKVSTRQTEQDPLCV
jgi:hypothetical protein